MKHSNLFLVSAPSGTGKSSLINSVLDRADKSKFPLELSISYTTRKPRIGETDSDHYFFISPEEFAIKSSSLLKVFSLVFSPIILAINAVSSRILRLIKLDIKKSHANDNLNTQELRTLLEESGELIPFQFKEMLSSIKR